MLAKRIQDAVEFLKSQVPVSPRLGIVLGSGLTDLSNALTETTTIPYRDIPYFHGISVEGKAGALIFGKLKGIPTVMLSGRFHLYEGYPMDEVVFPVRVLCAWGIETLLLTNSAGGINTRYRPGDLMLIEDHINLMGDNPLKGPNISEMGPRFPDLTETYNKRIHSVFTKQAKEQGLSLFSGIYAGMLGPTYETPAEVRMLRTLGADAVGMSSVPEAIAAHHLGVAVGGICSITNLAAGMGTAKVSHEEVLRRSSETVASLQRLLLASIEEIVNTQFE